MMTTNLCAILLEINIDLFASNEVTATNSHKVTSFSRHLLPHLSNHRLARDLYRVEQKVDLERLPTPPTRSLLTDLKNRRIALRIDDPELRRQLSELLMKNGFVRDCKTVQYTRIARHGHRDNCGFNF